MGQAHRRTCDIHSETCRPAPLRLDIFFVVLPLIFLSLPCRLHIPTSPQEALPVWSAVLSPTKCCPHCRVHSPSASFRLFFSESSFERQPLAVHVKLAPGLALYIKHQQLASTLFVTWHDLVIKP